MMGCSRAEVTVTSELVSSRLDAIGFASHTRITSFAIDLVSDCLGVRAAQILFTCYQHR